jgi:hypothetical protein
MEVLRNLFGSLTSGIIRLAVTVGVLAAVYFFLLRPVLDTTNHALDQSSKIGDEIRRSFQGPDLHEINKTIENVNHQVQAQIHRSFHVAKVHGNPQKLIHCVKQAQQDVAKLERCTRKY